MTNSIEEISDARCILVVGSNTTVAHPVLALRVKQAVAKGAKLIVANPREIELCRFAHIFLRLMPGTDVALLKGMLKSILDEGLWNRDFVAQRCENFEAFEESLKGFDVAQAAEITGVSADLIVEAARLYAISDPSSILYTLGITQHTHGTDNVFALANLAMLTGQIGKRASGVNPLRGANNVQGACDMGSLPDFFPAYQRVADKAALAKFSAAWGVELSGDPGLTVEEMVKAAHDGTVKALYVMGENPLLSDPDVNHVRAAFGHLEFLVVQDIFLSETAQMADVVLPAATFAEKDGTFTNTERRVQRVRKAIEPIGQARADWAIVGEVARRVAKLKGISGISFDYSSAAQVFAEAASLAPSYGGMSHGRLETGGLQWPCPTPDHPGTPTLHVGRFSRGKGKFMPVAYRPPDESVDGRYPLLLTTGRLLYHFHTGTMTRRVAGLDQLRPEELVEINPDDAAPLDIADGDLVKVSSRRGEVRARAKLTEDSPRGVIFMTFHFVESPANALTNPAYDPVAKTPEFKVAAVRLEKVEAREEIRV